MSLASMFLNKLSNFHAQLREDDQWIRKQSYKPLKKSIPASVHQELIKTYEKRLQAQAEELAKLQELAQQDPLTGLLNRRGIVTALHRQMHMLQRLYKKYKGELPPGFSLIFIDLDKFKQVNDKLGHEEGDRVLKTISQEMKKYFHRDTDILGRHGGDEFVIILPGITEHETLSRAELFCTKLQENEALLFPGFAVTASIGLTFEVAFEDSDIDKAYADALGKADEAMYLSKESGGNCASLKVSVG